MSINFWDAAIERCLLREPMKTTSTLFSPSGVCVSCEVVLTTPCEGSINPMPTLERRIWNRAGITFQNSITWWVDWAGIRIQIQLRPMPFACNRLPSSVVLSAGLDGPWVWARVAFAIFFYSIREGWGHCRNKVKDEGVRIVAIKIVHHSKWAPCIGFEKAGTSPAEQLNRRRLSCTCCHTLHVH